jgi:hypothetical protein
MAAEVAASKKTSGSAAAVRRCDAALSWEVDGEAGVFERAEVNGRADLEAWWTV